MLSMSTLTLTVWQLAPAVSQHELGTAQQVLHLQKTNHVCLAMVSQSLLE